MVKLWLSVGKVVVNFVGSVLFLPSLEQWKIWGVWLFIVGAGFMLLGALGEFMVKYYERRNGGR